MWGPVIQSGHDLALATAPVRAFFFDRSLPMTGGVAHSFVIFGRHADPGRIAVHAISCHDIPPDAMQAFAGVGIASTSVGDDGYLRPALRLRRLVASERPDVILCSSFKPYLLAKFAAAGTSTRVVFWHVAIGGQLKGRARQFLYHTLARRDDAIANSQATLDAFAFRGQVGKSHVVHLGVEDWTVLPEATPLPKTERAMLGIPADAFVIGYTAGFVPYKRHCVLTAAFAELARQHPDMHLLLIGVGALQDALSAEIARAPHAGRVHFLGARRDARGLLGIMDVYVHPADGEGFGLAVVEAMLAGLPVVAARSGAFPEYILHGQNGLLVPVDDPAAFACAIATLHADADLRTRLGAQARATARTRFSPAGYAAALTEAIEMFV